ncbi:leucine-rich repeat-containing protein 15-like [Chironomus tepperi]|uniref:leucine-rich repeat-containing protein 15-like n=1 Tax=Chironomus tepperi TaxID=113505 RepID=UPI00391F8961
MWQKLPTILLMTWIISSVDAAQITCQIAKNTCNVISATAVASPIEAVTVAGLPPNQVLTDIKKISFIGANFEYFPSGIFKIFTGLNAVLINGNTSPYLLHYAFSNCLNLVTIQITNANLKQVDGNFAKTCTGITSLYLVKNNIVSIHYLAFAGLQNLQYLDMSYNQITCLPFNLFQVIPNIATINLQYNKITALDWNLFKGLPNLSTVNLAFNTLATIPYFELAGTGTGAKGISFNFESNQLKSLVPEMCSTLFQPAYNVENMYLSNNPCLLTNVIYINKHNCDQMESAFKTCYQNWFPITNNPIRC